LFCHWLADNLFIIASKKKSSLIEKDWAEQAFPQYILRITPKVKTI